MGSRRPARESPATTDSEAGRSDPRHWADRACVRGRSCLHAAGYAQQSQRRDQPDHRHRPVSGYTLTRVFELFSTPTRFYVVAAVERSAGATFCVVPREELGLPAVHLPGAQSCRPVQFGSIFVRGCPGPVRGPAAAGTWNLLTVWPRPHLTKIYTRRSFKHRARARHHSVH